MIAKTFKGIGYFLIIMLVLGFIGRLVGIEESPERTEERQAANWHHAALVGSQTLIAASLRDPASAQWRNRVVYRQTDPTRVAVCGEVNARNAFGGYAGFIPFYSVWVRSGGGAQLIAAAVFESRNRTAFEREFARVCAGTVLTQRR